MVLPVRLKLVLIKNGKRTREVLLPTECIIGRRKDCGLRVLAHDISRRHCRIRVAGGVARVKDLGSTNGTFVNGKPISGEQMLRVGDTLKIGPVVFELDVADPEGTSLIVGEAGPPQAPPRAEVLDFTAEPASLPRAVPVDEPDTVHQLEPQPPPFPPKPRPGDLPFADVADDP